MVLVFVHLAYFALHDDVKVHAYCLKWLWLNVLVQIPMCICLIVSIEYNLVLVSFLVKQRIELDDY